MSYKPAWPNSQFAKPVLNQIIALIQRDQGSAIAIVNPSLAPINEFHKGPGLRTALPWLTVSVDSLTFAADALGTRQSLSRIALTLDVGQYDREMAQDNVQDYARVMDMVITTASEADWETPLAISLETVPAGVTTPSASGSIKEVFVESHHYEVVTVDEIETPLLRLTLNLAFTLEET
ncbi:MAG TPA: hypothetical protein VG206_11130 [Terriglobia bacterium]|nr:hypothetical protein [Terriglobia bacterium]